MVYLSCGLGAILLLAFLVLCNKQRSVLGVFIKAMVSVCFILTAGFAIIQNPQVLFYGILLIFGLLFGLHGDIFLDLKWVYPPDDHKYLLMGFSVFGIGHLFYIAAITMTAGLKLGNFIIPLVLGLVIAIGNLLLEKPMKQDFGKFRPIVTVYGFILAFSTGTALSAMIASDFAAAWVLFFVGGVLFLLSDLVLSPMYFGEGKNTPINFVINHTLYYAAQFCIALTILFIDPKLVMI